MSKYIDNFKYSDTQTIKVKFSETLKDLIVSNNFTLSYIAEKLNINHSTLSKYTRNLILPKIPRLISLCNFFNCSADYMFQLSDSKKSFTRNNKLTFFERIEKARHLNNISQKTLDSRGFLPVSLK